MGQGATRAGSTVKRLFVYLLVVFCAAVSALAQRRISDCARCAEWNRPQKPFRIFGNTYYVGTHGLSSILITSQAGHVLIDGALPDSAPQIAGNIRLLGFRVRDMKIILNSHAHFDHAGGIAALQRLSGARVMASEWSARVLKTGGPVKGDPQYVGGIPIAPAANVRRLRDGEQIKLGEIALTMHLTPGHTPGGTSWTWISCEGSVCRHMVYADSLTPISSDGFRFSSRSDYPEAASGFEKSFVFLETTPCDVLMTPHPEASGLWHRLDLRQKGTDPDPMVNPEACRQLAQQGREAWQKRLSEERGEQAIEAK